MKNDFFESVYKIDGKLPDPYGVLNVIKTASDANLPSIISQIKKDGLDVNINIRKEVEKYVPARSILKNSPQRKHKNFRSRSEPCEKAPAALPRRRKPPS